MGRDGVTNASCVPPLSFTDESRLERALERSLEIMDESGVDVHEAMAKAATELKVPRGHLPLMTRCYNIGQSEQTRRSGVDVFSRTQDHDVADPEKVAALLYETPAPVKTAAVVSLDYSVPPDATVFRKSANDLEARLARWDEPAPAKTGDPFAKVSFQHQKVAQLKGRSSRARDQYCAAIARLDRELRKLAGWCRDHRDVSMSGLAETCQAVEPVSRHIFESLYDNYGDLAKRATLEPDVTPERYDPVAEPYATVTRLIELASAAATAKDNFARLDKEAREAEEALQRPFVQAGPAPNLGLGRTPPPESTPPADPHVKAGGIFWPALVSAGASSAGKSLGTSIPMFQDKSDLQDKVYNSLVDPAHENRIRGIQSEAMLNDLLANDDVIKGYDPQDVAQSFNELTQIAPRMANQSGLMRAYLRRKLTQGALDPFELDTLVKLENNLKKRDAPGDFSFGDGGSAA